MPDREKVITGLVGTMKLLAVANCMIKHGFPNIESDIYDNSLAAISDAITILKDQEPVINVVCCKDCKYGEEDTNSNGEDMVMCTNKLNPMGFENWLMPPEFYCADGERGKEQQGEETRKAARKKLWLQPREG